MLPVLLPRQHDGRSFQLATAQQTGGPLSRVPFFRRGGAFIANSLSAHLHKGQQQLRQHRQRRYAASHCQIKLFPPEGIPPAVLRPGVAQTHVRKAQFLHHRIQKIQTLLQRIHQHHIQVRPGDGQRQAGKTRASAHVDQARAFGEQSLDAQRSQRIQIVPPERGLKIRIARQVHDLIPLGQQLVVAGQSFRGGGVVTDVQRVQPVFQPFRPLLPAHSFSPRYRTAQYFPHASTSLR